MSSHDSIPGARIKLWVKNDDRFDTIEYSTDENGFYETEKLNINGDLIINIEASKQPEYQVTVWNGLDFSAVSTPGEISGGNQYDTWIVNFGLSPIMIDYQVMPDTLFYSIKYEEADASGFIYDSLTILNTGTGTLAWKINSPTDWIYTGIDPESPNDILENEFDIVKIGVNRYRLVQGNYSGSVEISTSDTVKKIIPVYVTVY
jgi:hypothetical protein